MYVHVHLQALNKASLVMLMHYSREKQIYLNYTEGKFSPREGRSLPQSHRPRKGTSLGSLLHFITLPPFLNVVLKNSGNHHKIK